MEPNPPGRIRTTLREIDIDGLKEQVRVVHLSDIHLGHFRGHKFMKEIVDKTNQQKPDIICITGDLFDVKGIQLIGLNHMRADSSSLGMHTSQGPTIKETLQSLPIIFLTRRIFRYNRGLYQYQQSKILVSEGIG